MQIGFNQFPLLAFTISKYMIYICNLNPVFELGVVTEFSSGVLKSTEHQSSISLVCSDLISEMLPDKRVLKANKSYLNGARESVLY